ncbi:polysaccharide pyruvyl transferase family protein [Streptomyces spinosirectus]|uniref:polysaccharide pyruvyl transferase family protein n=1 Tax=Streptomyces TaxID=1883 RepID=UPI000D3A7760|nr:MULTISPECIES: polysaccharide pyruvyl transferase family protein [Streptomyces]MBY8343098.1 polysaccharide pyruvyl transferase family protein [Streptomyces plumbidurans]PTM88213.1 polysaccharide pyruvyl transferase WcaK-like protein [Streptomyces sp. VMFN-G11Ma]UIR18133.1 polysaccharide pyruvyl transferase family protein [Streptomyces spinosirectus]
MKRILLRSGKSPFDVFPVEEALHQDVIATNSGNLIFSDAAHKILEAPGTEVVANGMRTDVAAAEQINEEYDAFVVPLANAFRPSFEISLKRLTRLISRLRIPVVVVGIGAQAGLNYNAARLKPMEESVRAFVSAVLDRSASIGVRGEFTEKYLKDLGYRDVEVIGCPSLFMYGKELAVDKRAPALTADSRIAINGSHSVVQKQGLDKLIERTHARYPNLTFVGQNLSDARQLHWRDLSHPNAAVTGIPTHPDHPMFREDKVRVYVDPVTWIDDLRDYDFSFGSRIHGNIAALLAGTPATVLCGDSRTLELCRYFEIPHRRIDKQTPGLDPAQLYEEADFTGLTGNHLERFERFTGFLERNGLENTFTHGDGGAAFEARLRSLDFPPGVRPWNDTDITSLTSRFGWLHTRISELTLDNAQLKRELERRAAKTATPGSSSVYRRARSAVGRPIRRALQAGKQ